MASGKDQAIARTTALGAVETDGFIDVPASRWDVVSGTWTVAQDGTNGISAARTAAGSTDVLVCSVPLHDRSTASKGIRIDSLEVHYTAATAVVDDITLACRVVTHPVDGTLQTVANYGGLTVNDTDADAAHDTAAERADITGAPEQHTMTLTPPTPAFITGGIELVFTVDGDAGGAGEITLRNTRLNVSYADDDLT